jgi:uncharacterized protein (UPF0261 family)
LRARLVDLSLGSAGAVWDGARKLRAIEETGARIGAEVAAMLDGGVGAVVGLGGGTGRGDHPAGDARPALRFPKILITTLPFDPRPALADNAITLVPTLVDICGLNPALRRVFTETAAMVAGLCRAEAPGAAEAKSVAVTALGATGGAAEALVRGSATSAKRPPCSTPTAMAAPPSRASPGPAPSRP